MTFNIWFERPGQGGICLTAPAFRVMKMSSGGICWTTIFVTKVGGYGRHLLADLHVQSGSAAFARRLGLPK